ncbi:hypothetical protein QJS66_04180 [Kocuria rhizophila]|nr:hypothetical protein QJS66_04180 [Kocuria rhizophila]
MPAGIVLRRRASPEPGSPRHHAHHTAAGTALDLALHVRVRRRRRPAGHAGTRTAVVLVRQLIRDLETMSRPGRRAALARVRKLGARRVHRGATQRPRPA